MQAATLRAPFMCLPLLEICLTADLSLLHPAGARNLPAVSRPPAGLGYDGAGRDVPLLRHPSRRLRRAVLALVALVALGATGFALGSSLTINLTTPARSPQRHRPPSVTP